MAWRLPDSYKVRREEALAIQTLTPQQPLVAACREIRVNADNLREQINLPWIKLVFTPWGTLNPKRPQSAKDDGHALAAALWEILRYYFTPARETTELFPFVTPLLPEHLRDEVTLLCEVAGFCVRAVEIWVPPLRWGQFWYPDIGPEQKVTLRRARRR